MSLSFVLILFFFQKNKNEYNTTPGQECFPSVVKTYKKKSMLPRKNPTGFGKLLKNFSTGDVQVCVRCVFKHRELQIPEINIF